jgi:hypothetical protein
LHPVAEKHELRFAVARSRLLRQNFVPNVFGASENRRDKTPLVITALLGVRRLLLHLLLFLRRSLSLSGQILQQLTRVAAAQINNQRQNQHSDSAASDRNSFAAHSALVFDV